MSEASGQNLGKYALAERLGRGGMAEVYKAFHPGLNRHVAIKILYPHLSDDADFLGRFRREAQSIAQLHHPNIVQVFDFDAEAGRHYMVMEYVRGPTLQALLDDCYARSDPLPVEHALSIMGALLDAVAYAHENGMVHRDLKPANVLLENWGEAAGGPAPPAAAYRPVLTDFGIAKILGATRFTATGMMMGTPAYMSPEQGQGQSGDERSDIYALGIILFECLTGQVPYDGDTSMAVLVKHMSAPIPAVSQSRAGLPAAFDQIVSTAMAKDPADRFASAREMRAALDAALSQTAAAVRPAQAPTAGAPRASRPASPPGSPAERPTRLVPVRTPVLRAALVGLALLAAAVLVVPRFLSGSPADPAMAEAEQHLAAGNFQLAADAYTEALARDPGHVPALLGRASAYERLGLVFEAYQDVEQAVALAPDDPAAYQERARLGVQYGLEPDPERVLADLDRAVGLAPDSAQAHFVRGWAILNFPLIGGRASPEAALDDLRAAASLDPQSAEIHLTLAQALLAAGDPLAALTPANRAVELEPDAALNRTRRAHLHFLLNDWHAAQADLTAAIEREPEAPARSTLYAERAFLALRLNEPGTARADLDRALADAPDSLAAQAVAALLDPSYPRAAPAQLEQARAFAPDDPIWQAIFAELLGE